jgi:hypothetical protein
MFPEFTWLSFAAFTATEPLINSSFHRYFPGESFWPNAIIAACPPSSTERNTFGATAPALVTPFVTSNDERKMTPLYSPQNLHSGSLGQSRHCWLLHVAMQRRLCLHPAS